MKQEDINRLTERVTEMMRTKRLFWYEDPMKLWLTGFLS